MGDTLIDAVRRARSWPAGSGARKTLAKAAQQLLNKRKQEVADMEALLERQWQWLERNGDPGTERENSERYEDGMKRFQATLVDYEDLKDGLESAREELASLRKAA